LGIGDWGLGIGQSPIPNPQSPITYNNTKQVKEKVKCLLNIQFDPVLNIIKLITVILKYTHFTH